ncbi:TPA: hypothetical protein I4D48_18825 [Enterobacter hormaechei]|nr:hypothetical protein [Enterobacter hormaechei]
MRCQFCSNSRYWLNRISRDSRLKGNRRLSAIGNALVGIFFIGFAARLANTSSLAGNKTAVRRFFSFFR